MLYRATLLGLVAAFAVSAADVTVMDEIVCKVNGDIITRDELGHSRKLMEDELRRQGLNGARLAEALNVNSKNILRERIDQLLLIQKGKELDLKIDPEVAKQIADIQRKAKIADPEKFRQFVREQTGMPFEDYRDDLKNQMLTQRVIRQEVSGKIQFKKEDLKAYYDAHKDDFMRQERIFLREILVSTEGKDAAGLATAERKAKDLVARARKGEKFQELAISNSDAATAPQGGEMPPFEKGQLLAQIEDAVWTKDRGYVTDPIKVANGFEIIRVEEHNKAGLASLEEVESVVTEQLFQPRMEPALRAYLTKLRQDAFLEIKPGYDDTGAAPGKETAWVDPAQIKPETVTKEEVASRGRRRHLFGVIPVPVTSTNKAGTSSSQ